MNNTSIDLAIHSNQNNAAKSSYSSIKLSSFFKASLSVIGRLGKILFSSYKVQVLHRLSQNLIVGLETSSSWGILLPETNGSIALLSDDLIKVLVYEEDDGQFILKEKLWKLDGLRFFELSISTKLRVGIATIVRAKLLLDKELNTLVSHAAKTKELCSLMNNQSEYILVANKFNSLYQHELEVISQLKLLQSTQDKSIEQLLFSLKVIEFEQTHLHISFKHYQVVLAEAMQKYQDSIAYINKDVNLLPAKIICN
ncbi:hypothetical protein [Chlorogloea sp. CCALA 695]|uniref:hypothetical protein n=1 Tax=Chlorogloea sp. CCALA 695 TaxID=2107693 RepID=UPI000D081D29|nr:hypothetical protein [Chlorogloea sp. CCALA 695]PSB30822.1 hypothetical protein C7B70_15315 [Chlorogloea sp. CCALA 695]